MICTLLYKLDLKERNFQLNTNRESYSNKRNNLLINIATSSFLFLKYKYKHFEKRKIYLNRKKRKINVI